MLGISDLTNTFTHSCIIPTMFSLYKMRELGSTVRRGTQNETCVCSEHIVVCVYQIKYMHFCVCVTAKNKRTHSNKWECIVGMGRGCVHTYIHTDVHWNIHMYIFLCKYVLTCVHLYVHTNKVLIFFSVCFSLFICCCFTAELGVWDT